MKRCRSTAVLAMAGLGLVCGCTTSWIGNGQLMDRIRCRPATEGTLVSSSAPCCGGEGPILDDPTGSGMVMPGNMMTVPGNGGLPMISSQPGVQPGAMPMPRSVGDEAAPTVAPQSRVKPAKQ